MSSQDPNILKPVQEESFWSKAASFLFSIIIIPVYVICGIVGLVLFLIVTFTGIGPSIEYYYAGRDKNVFNREIILKNHKEMFLLEIPGNVNLASGSQPYKVMVRLTKPSNDSNTNSNPSYQNPSCSTTIYSRPPIIFPGGLASNLIAMSTHQDLLTKKHGFTVVNFDRMGVGLSDPNPTGKSPSAADVAHEMYYVMQHCGIDPNAKWIQIGGSMGTNVATALICLYPNKIHGFFNLDGLPHGFIKVSCRKFLESGPQVANVRYLLWTGIFRFVFNFLMYDAVIRNAVEDSSFTDTEMIASMLQPQQWINTSLEYATLMSCCDLEINCWGKQATTALDTDGIFLMASLAPTESVLVNEHLSHLKSAIAVNTTAATNTAAAAAAASEQRVVTSFRSSSELGTQYTSKDSAEFQQFWIHFQSLAVKSSEEIDIVHTNCNRPTDVPTHPVGTRIGGINEMTDKLYPLVHSFSRMIVRVMTARDYKGLESEYPQSARNHSMARSNIHALMALNGKSYIYPQLSHLNLWQQKKEIARVAVEMAIEMENIPI